MSYLMPLVVDPWLLFRRNCEIVGKLPLLEMPNLQSSQNREDGDADVRIAVVRREDGQIVIKGVADVDVEVKCQRCLGALAMSVNADFELALVKYEHQLSSLSSDDDAIICEDNLEILPLVEQELILSLPMIAKHEDCQAVIEKSIKVDADTHQPFANLKDLLS